MNENILNQINAFKSSNPDIVQKYAQERENMASGASSAAAASTPASAAVSTSSAAATGSTPPAASTGGIPDNLSTLTNDILDCITHDAAVSEKYRNLYKGITGNPTIDDLFVIEANIVLDFSSEGHVITTSKIEALESALRSVNADAGSLVGVLDKAAVNLENMTSGQRYSLALTVHLLNFIWVVLTACSHRDNKISNATLRYYENIALRLIAILREDKVTDSEKCIDNVLKKIKTFRQTDTQKYVPDEPEKVFPVLPLESERAPETRDLNAALLDFYDNLKNISAEARAKLLHDAREQLNHRLNKNRSSMKVDPSDIYLAEKMLLITDQSPENCMPCLVHLNNRAVQDKSNRFGAISEMYGTLKARVDEGRKEIFTPDRFASRMGRLIVFILLTVAAAAAVIVAQEDIFSIGGSLGSIFGYLVIAFTVLSGLVTGGILNMIIHFVLPQAIMVVMLLVKPEFKFATSEACAIMLLTTLPLMIFRFFKAVKYRKIARRIAEKYTHLPGEVERVLNCVRALSAAVEPMYSGVVKHSFSGYAFLHSIIIGYGLTGKNYSGLAEDIDSLLYQAKSLAKGKYV